jgi:AcrR family transcriptional regulator
MEAADRDAVQRLPAGAHGIPSDIVTRNQRERLVAAVAEACAEKSYAETSVAELSTRAGVSTATFYKLFAGKHECALEAHRELLERLLEEVDQVCATAQDAGEKVRAGVRTILVLFATDPPTARLLTTEVLALGPAGAARNDAAIAAFATRLRAAGDRRGEGDGLAAWTTVAGVSALIGQRVMAGEATALPQLEDELVAMATAP